MFFENLVLVFFKHGSTPRLLLVSDMIIHIIVPILIRTFGPALEVDMFSNSRQQYDRISTSVFSSPLTESYSTRSDLHLWL